MTALWVEITGTRGSAPRDTGTAMKVTEKDIEGTIGGGALEHRAVALARDLMARGDAELSRSYPLGPDLGQCCGGAVTLRFTRQPCRTDAVPQTPLPAALPTGERCDLWLWGAGHVGRAVALAAPPEAFRITWIDSAAERFPKSVPDHATALPAADMPLLATRAPQGAHHLIFTYSHDIDFALCAALLDRGATAIGLIGSDTKRARFFKRLRAAGLDPAPITCPIGDKSLGKRPDQIARGTIAALMAGTCETAAS
ncbi:xanthine dehydrogenase accessory protein XdhC [Sulfitobacter sp. D35]|uniref:xanthine dehydrogenase accessory protein XdhC n=1 Tax=Sulfitobacter sp. D35 TaxID=3083252 RepID=UPI00296F0179|nr:xanthine dehydrogenase accessory protein XdhC [Sulfitobacter sp. D35]MDW4500405.1 xanthine dehydrogenase accessory protein XdhC [Sulfitobacter sp. D35]